MTTDSKDGLAVAKGIRDMEREVKLSTVHHVAIWLGAATSLLTLAIVIWKGGMLNERVDSDSRRIDKLELRGSTGLQAHEVMDDTRIKSIEERLRRVEDAVLTLAVIKSDVAEIKTSIEFLTGKRTVPKP